jgi:hypothetical protein
MRFTFGYFGWGAMKMISRLSATALLVLPLLLAVGGSTGRASAQAVQIWDLEPGLSQAHLVMVARVASISRVTVVEGAKTDVSLREFRFQPVRKLRGLFQRDELSMTASDLGFLANEATGSPPLREGEYRLLILVQQQGQTFGCVSMPPGARGFEERVPLLSGPEDPLVAAVEALLKVTDSRSRRERAGLVLDQLASAQARADLPSFASPDARSQENIRIARKRHADAEGRAAVPLLASLQKRADWAAADERGYEIVARLAGDESPTVRAAAVAVLGDMLATRVAPPDREQLTAVGEALRDTLEEEGTATVVRLAALQAVGRLLALSDDFDWPLDLLVRESAGASTYAERTTAVTALAEFDDPEATTAVLAALEGLPLDEQPERELAFAAAARRRDPERSERILLKRLERSMAAGQSLRGEVTPLGRLKSEASVPLLIEAAARPEAANNDHHYIAWALGVIRDDRAAPVLAKWVQHGRNSDVSLTALATLDSAAAAREARPLLKPMADLHDKLRLARLLARHDMADGYAMATEHLADTQHLAAATLVLAALDDPRTASDLAEIVAAQPNRRWYAAALAGLAAVGNADARKELRDILSDDRHPLVVDAAEAAGLAGDVELLAPLAKLAQSRNRILAEAALLALRRALAGVRTDSYGLRAATWSADDVATHDRNEQGVLLPAAEVPAEMRATIAEAVATIAADPYVDGGLRVEAFAVARLAFGPGFPELLEVLADQAELESGGNGWTNQGPSGLLEEVQVERRRLRRHDIQ